MSKIKDIPKCALVRLSTIEMKPIVFVDKPLFQANAFHLLVGKKNAGKGTFLSSVAAQFTRDELGENHNVIWVAAGEDSLSLDVRPRIEAAGGNATRIFCPDIAPKLPEAANQVREWIADVGRVGLVILDPVSGMMPQGKSSNHDFDVRPAIEPLNWLADEMRCVVVGVRHLKKDTTSGALDSVLGSTDWVNVPRAVLGIVKDNEDDDVRHVQVLTGNRVPSGTFSRSFRIEGANIVAGGEPVTKAVFISNEGKDVDEILAAEKQTTSGKKTRAMIAILDMLELQDCVLSKDVDSEVMQVCRASKDTLKKARAELKELGLIQYDPLKDETGQVQQWTVRRTGLKRPLNLGGKRRTGPVIVSFRTPAA